jgi:ribosomal protein S18 acetylase RimI-like enzyme
MAIREARYRAADAARARSIAVTAGDRERDVRDLWTEYLAWITSEVQRRVPGTSFDAMDRLDDDLARVHQFRPPYGCLVLAIDGDAVAGGGALRRIGPSIAEVKRLYVRPAHRRAGFGRRLIRELLDVARRTECDEVRLESPRFATEAHALYRAFGFREIRYYSESECSPDMASECVFMSVTFRREIA